MIDLFTLEAPHQIALSATPLRVLLFCILVLWVSACAPHPELRNEAYVADDSLITDDPCAAPCWNDLTPGVTEWRTGFAAIAQDRETWTQLDRVTDPDSDQQIVNFHFQNGPQCCRIFTRSGAFVDQILLLLAPEIRMGQLVERHGEPDYVQATDVTNDETFVSLVYVDVPMIVYAFSNGIARGELSPESEIVGVVYMSADEMSRLLVETELYAWVDYGPLEGLLSGPPAEFPAEETDNES